MTNDAMASEMISKLLSGDLSTDEKRTLDDYLATTEEARSFASLSSLIQRSVLAASSDDFSENDRGGLSDIAKEKLRRSVRKAKLDSMAKSQNASMRVAEQDTAYFVGEGGTNTETGLREESRQAVARFTLLQKIGEGGLGTVWLARDEKLSRNVALKEMNTHAAESSNLFQRFQREAEITGHLEHPNVVPLYLSGVNPETGLPFYAMRFLGKRTLSEAIREYHSRRASGEEDAIGFHRLLSAFLDVCQAIAFAHSRGVIHRDLKPENIALDSFGQVLVLDWGLAKLMGDGELAMRLMLSGKRGDSHLGQTLYGDVVGTPLYMAPEQAAGDLDEVDSRTDVYGLGAILFGILTGNAPHENSNKSTDGKLRVRDFLDSIIASDTPRARDFNPDVSRDLEAICLRAMAKEKFARHASATDIANDVEGWIAGSHKKETRYDAMRMTARDLKSRLCVQVRQLAAAAQFMVELPPIQGLITTLEADEKEYATWRDRLAKVLVAFAKSKPNISGLSYSRIVDDRITELLRVERSLLDVSNIRNIPQGRLRNGAASTFHKTVMQQFPGECSIDLDFTTAGQTRVVCGVPVFDTDSEQPFGLVCVEAEVGNLVLPELNVLDTRDEVYLVEEGNKVLFTTDSNSKAREMPAEQTMGGWQTIVQILDQEQEFIDPDRELYVTRLVFPQRNNSLYVVLRIAD